MVYQNIGNRAGNLLVWSHLTLGPPPLQGQTSIAKLKSAYNSLIIGPLRFGMVYQHIGNHGQGIFWCG